MDDPEIDLRLDPPRPGSHTGTYGEPAIFRARGWGLTPPAGFFLSHDSPYSRILECAVEGEAEAIVTCDKAMPALGEYQGIRLISLAGYLDRRGRKPK